MNEKQVRADWCVRELSAERESRAWEGWFRKSGKVVLAWAYWRKFGVTRVLDVCPEGCRGYWSENGKQWWQVEACAPRGKRVRVAHVKAAYRAACGEMPWEVPFFDGSEKNLARLAKMYDYVMRVLSRGNMDEETVDRRLERAATARGFNRFANRGLLYGGFFQ